MRNRIFAVLLVVSVLTLMAGSVFADGLTQDPKRRVSLYVKVNEEIGTGSTSTVDATVDQLVPAGTVTPDDRILGFLFTAIPDSKGKVGGAILGLYDTTAVSGNTTTNMVTEAEATPTNPTVLVLFSYPLNLTNQLVISIKGNAVFTLMYEDVSAY